MSVSCRLLQLKLLQRPRRRQLPKVGARSSRTKSFDLQSSSFARAATSTASDATAESFAHFAGFESGRVPNNYFSQNLNAAKKLLDWASGRLQLQGGLSGWYHVSSSKVSALDPTLARLIRRYDESIADTLQAVYPDHPWEPWKFQPIPKSCFATAQGRRKFLDHISKDLGVEKLDDWHRVSAKMIVDKGGQALLTRFRGNLFDLLSDAFPGYKFQPWRFSQVRKGFWKDAENCKRFFEWAATSCKVSKLDDWYKVTPSELSKLGGSTLVVSSKHVSSALKRAFPEHKWNEWLFETSPKGFWEKPANVRRYFEWLVDDYLPQKRPESSNNSTKSLDSLYELSYEDLSATGGLHMIHKNFDGSLSAALRAAFPEHEWIDWKFEKVPKDTWLDIQKQRECLESIAKEMKLDIGSNNLSAWYSVTAEQLKEYKQGRSLLSTYADSLSRALLVIYPDHNWDLWRFSPAPHGFWTAQVQKGDYSALKSLVTTSVAPKLRIESPEDWYRVSGRDLRQQGVSHIISMFGGLPNVLKSVYPDHKWDDSLLARRTPKKSRQLRLLQALRDLFPGKTITEEARTHQNRTAAEMDLILPDLALAVEFQGEHHYADVMDVGLADRKAATDQAKAAAVQSKGYTLISVPYWWDGTTASLGNSIRSSRPDLIPAPLGDGSAIPDAPQTNRKQKSRT